MIIRGFRINSISLRPLINGRAIFTGNRLLDESSSDEENDKSKSKLSKDEAAKKLNELILVMAKREPPSKLASQVNIPKPREANRQKGFEMKKQRKFEAEQREKEKLGNKLADAANKVAESFGGDTKKTEMELLDIYFSRRQKPPISEKESELSSEKKSLTDVLTGMKVEQDKDSFPGRDSFLDKDEQLASRAHVVRSMASEKRPRQFTRVFRQAYQPKTNIFGEQPFKYFDVDKIKAQNVTPVSLTTWDHLYARNLKLQITHPPKNIFEQLIQWTEQGKVWRFPIDNEQDWFEEQKYDFSDHVFLERWLEPWCPETGPVRDFMQLVCLGLSKNPYLTVPEKQAHIFWYEHYFRSKKQLLIDTGSGEIKDRPPAESSSA